MTSIFYTTGTNTDLEFVDKLDVDHNIVVVNYAGGAAAAIATGISGSVSGNLLQVNAVTAGSISVKATIVGLPGGKHATILSQLGGNRYGLSGVVVSGSFTGAVTLRATTSAALLEMAHAAGYGTVTVADNYVDPTGALSCIQHLDGPISGWSASGNTSLVTGTPITGIGYKVNGATCGPLY